MCKFSFLIAVANAAYHKRICTKDTGTSGSRENMNLRAIPLAALLAYDRRLYSG